jgi:thiol-disulfide isomerase/thioredoxin
MRRMVSLCLIWFAALALFFPPQAAIGGPGMGHMVPLSRGDAFPEVVISGSPSPAERSYLGLESAAGFRLTDIDAELVVVELLSTYCQSCQKMAPVLDMLYDTIEADSALRGKVKIIGIGLGNSPVELHHYRQESGGKFPLFPDPDFKMLDVIGETRTPLIVFVRQVSGSAVVVAAKLDYDPNPKTLLASLKAALVQDVSAIRYKRPERVQLDVLSVISQERLHDLLQEGADELSGEAMAVERQALEGVDHLYAIRMQDTAGDRWIFAKVGSGVATCDVCEDVYFIYFFDRRGRIRNLKAVQLSKSGNQAFGEKDMAKVKSRLVGKYIFDPFRFDAHVDAVSSATITTSVMFRTLDKSRALFEQLKTAGYLQ